ncbi:SPOSA6832_00530 [Sporobolomyces salmonicolor]|uniref:SPOSA6832_00530-mRNA-1:cds n=1 Tax=Sporidiobolus salmonicolor TaxID=5005 RepID=A0A0D6EG99_SPOSA|nr:SPOSA6832_00530 [Sporobolomyces salmonicolor]
MGKVKKAGKKGGGADAKATAKAVKKAKAEKKAASKDVKQVKKQRKGKGKEDDMDEDDLIRTLEEYRQQWADEHKVTEETVGGPPSRRANAVLTPCPVSDRLFLLGGEYYDGQKVELSTDTSRPRTNGDASLPLPSLVLDALIRWSARRRAAETAPNQSSFHHYRDLWSFDITSSTWERWDTKIRPSARSGHRMCVWKNYIFLFGGFQDTGIRTSYLNDLWCWSLTEYAVLSFASTPTKACRLTLSDSATGGTRSSSAQSTASQGKGRPLSPIFAAARLTVIARHSSARSGFSFLPTADGIVLHGGYTKTYEGKRVTGVALNDTWALKIPPIGEDGGVDFTKFKWEKRKNPGYAPNPARSGCTMAFWAAKGMGVLFGGVSDDDKDEETLDSTFYNELFGYNTAGNGRWISLPLKKKKKAGGANKKKKAKLAAAAAAAAAQKKQENGGDDEDDDDAAEDAKMEQDDGAGSDIEDAEDEEGPKPWEIAQQKKEEEAAQAEEDDPDDPEKTLPGPRYNAMLAVQRNTLYIYGGILEAGDREYTLDDFFTLDLTKLDRYNCLKECIIETAEWHGSDSENDDDSDSDDDEGSESGQSDEEGDEDEADREKTPEELATMELDLKQLQLTDAEIAANEAAKAQAEREELKQRAQAFMGVSTSTDRTAEDILSTPQPGETLAAFFARSRQYWTQKAHESIGAGNRGKELRRDGFQLAEKAYEEYKPILDEILRIQEQAGLDAAEAKATQRSGLGTESRNRR